MTFVLEVVACRKGQPLELFTARAHGFQTRERAIETFRRDLEAAGYRILDEMPKRAEEEA